VSLVTAEEGEIELPALGYTGAEVMQVLQALSQNRNWSKKGKLFCI
jgi:hypothetical protein